MLKKSLRIQEKLVSEAIVIIRNKGSVTLKDIADNTNCNIAAVNYHFKDKATFNRVIVNRVFDECIDWVLATERVQESSGKPVALKDIIEYSMQFIEQNVGVFRYVLSLGDESDEDGKILDAMISKLDELMNIVIKHLMAILPQFSREQLEIKYSLLFSGYIMPLIFKVSSIQKDRYFNDREGYLQEMMKGFMAE